MEKGIYSNEDKEIMIITNNSRNSSRIIELINFIKLNGYKKIGIASCLSVKKYAVNLKNRLIENGIDVVIIDCKESNLDASELSGELSGASCDPISQAQYLNEQNTEININFGLCLGHGLIFAKYSKAPVTTMLVKDACNKHNIMENFA